MQYAARLNAFQRLGQTSTIDEHRSGPVQASSQDAGVNSDKPDAPNNTKNCLIAVPLIVAGLCDIHLFVPTAKCADMSC